MIGNRISKYTTIDGSCNGESAWPTPTPWRRVNNYTVTESLKESVSKKKKNLCLRLAANGELELKPTHPYYFQIQGQLNICQIPSCDLVIYTNRKEIFIQTIARDQTLWISKMLPKLTSFYHNYILPELADPRIPRGLKIRTDIK